MRARNGSEQRQASDVEFHVPVSWLLGVGCWVLDVESDKGRGARGDEVGWQVAGVECGPGGRQANGGKRMRTRGGGGESRLKNVVRTGGAKHETKNHRCDPIRQFPPATVKAAGSAR